VNIRFVSIIVFLLAGATGARAQEGTFDDAAAKVQRQLEDSIAELDEVRDRIAGEKIPLSQELSDLEAELSQVRLDYQQASRLLDSRTLDLSNLRNEIKSRRDESDYVTGLMGDYIREFESRLHIAEIQRYEKVLDVAKLAPENSNLSNEDVFKAQSDLLAVSLTRLLDALGGTKFEGTAVDSSGLVRHGTFVLVGPAALFRSADGEDVGTAEQRLGSLEPAAIDFAAPSDTLAATKVLTTGSGDFPLDPTLGNAHKIEATEETLWEHINKGGAVMVPIFVMGGAALLVALYKWISLTLIRKPKKKQIDALLHAVADRDEEAARLKAEEIKGPVGRMLQAGMRHLKEPRDLIEEVMYETVLATRQKLQRMLPFIAICAASAPLLGLLGTVTGIIRTFKLITLFGSGDVKMLSSGISEALITTEFGLIVAIPSLLIHAFLSRRARGVIGQMENAAIAFANQVSRLAVKRPERVVHSVDGPKAEPDPDLVREQVNEILNDLLGPLIGGNADDELKRTQPSQP
jgi:biopolymer transport protein ExbB